MPIDGRELRAVDAPNAQRFVHRYRSIGPVGDYDLVARHGSIHSVLDVRGRGGPTGVRRCGVGPVHVHVMHVGPGRFATREHKEREEQSARVISSGKSLTVPRRSGTAPVALCSLRPLAATFGFRVLELFSF
jgi:hypothetical protein